MAHVIENHHFETKCKYCNKRIGYMTQDYKLHAYPGEGNPQVNYIFCPNCSEQIIVEPMKERI